MAPLNPLVVMLGASARTPDISRLVEAYRAHGLFKRWPTEYLALHGSGGLLCDAKAALAALRRFIAILARGRGAVIHAHVDPAHGFWRCALFIALSFAARRACIVHLHGGGLRRCVEGGNFALRAAVRFALESAASVVVDSEATGAAVRAIARRALVVRVPPPVAALEPIESGRRPALVLSFSRLDATSGIFDLLEALSGVRAAVPDVRLVCAGEGDRSAVLEYAERLGIADIVKFVGNVGPSARRALFESAAVIALPTYDGALPMEFLEAMAAGVPGVASPVGGVAEALVDGVSGLFAAPGDVASLQRLLRKLLLDGALRARLGSAARESVRLRCAPERALARLGELYVALGVRGEAEAAAAHPRAL